MTIRRVIFNFYWSTERVFNSNPPFFISVALLFSTTFLILLPIVCWKMPFSCFSSLAINPKEASTKLIQVNEAKFKAQKVYLKSLNPSTPNPYYNIIDKDKMKPDIAIGIVTVKRMYGSEELGYLTQVMANFDKILRDDKVFKSKALFICDVYPGPGDHSESIRLGKIFHRIARFPKGNASAAIQDPFEKEKEDYIYCLQKGLSFQPSYVLLVEDDTVPRPDTLKVIRHQLHRIPNELKNGNIGYIKLYYPERWQGFGMETKRLLELLAISVVGGILFLFISLLYTFGYYNRRCRTVKLVIFSMGAIYFLLVALAVGRQHLIELRRFSETFYTLTDAPECCTPAILYPSGAALKLKDSLSKTLCTNDFPLDLALEKFMSNAYLQRYLVEPNLFKHIGFVSSTKGLSRELRDFIMAIF